MTYTVEIDNVVVSRGNNEVKALEIYNSKLDSEGEHKTIQLWNGKTLVKARLAKF